MNKLTLSGLALSGLLLFSNLAAAVNLVETSTLQEAVNAGDLPPVQERVPSEPYVTDLEAKGRAIGQHGGELTTLISKAKSVRYMVVWGYARLLGYDEKYNLVPDILRAADNDANKVFTLHLRPGHKWSNGDPFTADDFLYFWNDIANNEMTRPSGPPAFMVVNGEPATVEKIDDVTVRYSWSSPNPDFLPSFAKARPPFIYRPSKFLKQFHGDYVDEASLTSQIEEAGVRNWAALHNRKDNMYKNNNPDLPSLQPWVNTTAAPANRFIMKRNPYFHRVDTTGQQLPYIDQVTMNVSSGGLISAKANAGETDLQSRGLSFSDITVLKEGESRHGYKTHLWPVAKASELALYPNLNNKDPMWRKLLRDKRFRWALSHGIDRKIINRSIFFGLAKESANTLLPSSPLFNQSYADAGAALDLDKANALLDEIGLTERDSDGFRKLPNGETLEIIIETAGESSQQVDVLQLMSETWREIGVSLFIKPSDRTVLRNRSYAGDTVMTVWSGWDNGIASADMSPGELAPTRQDNLGWPMWGQFYETKGQNGEAPDIVSAQRLMELYKSWQESTDKSEREAAWNEMLRIHADELFVIGIVSGSRQPVVVAGNLKNVPEVAPYSWDPGGQWGVCHPDEFYFSN